MLLITSYSAGLILLWDHLLSLELNLNMFFMRSVLYNEYALYGYITELLIFFSFPFFGLFADVWIGRYKTILFGIVMCFLSWILLGIAFILQSYIGSKEIFMAVYGISYFAQYAGFACFIANVIQYAIDQLVGASAEELNTVIYLHCATMPLSTMFLGFSSCFNSNEYVELVTFIVSGIAVSLVLVSHSFFKHKLENISLINNPVKLIIRVLWYAKKHKFPENRSALTYWEEHAPSRLDLGKEKYGGPFTEEEVEDVKTVFRMLPLFIVTIGNAISQNFDGFIGNSTSLLSCLQSNNFINSTTSILLFLVYFLLIKLVLYKFIPQMLLIMSMGLFVSLLSSILKMLFNSWSDIISEILSGLSYVLTNPVLLEFTVAQAPIHSRGVMVGVWYSSSAVGYTLSICLRFPFNCQSQYLCSSLYFYLTQALLIFIILIVFLILAKHYKYRVRDNEINIYQIVDGTYQNYIEQEREYDKKNRWNSEDISSS